MKQFQVLVVEDSKQIVPFLLQALKELEAANNVQIEVEVCDNLADAQIFASEQIPDVISTDMRFPLTEDGEVKDFVGAKLINWLQRAKLDVPTVIFCSMKEEEIRPHVPESFPSCYIIDTNSKDASNTWMNAIKELLGM